MAGHNKWSQIKHKKAKTDAQKGKVFSKMARELMMAAKLGGGDPDMNARLRLAIQKAKDANMPNDNIKRAIDKGVGGTDDSPMEEIMYEAYGPNGVAILIMTLTDNKNRTVPNIRAILSKAGGSLANNGAVSYLFDKKGVFLFDPTSDLEQVMTVALDAGADDVIEEDDGGISVTVTPDHFEALRQAFDGQGIPFENAALSMLPQTTVDLDDEGARKVLRLIEALEDDDDVQEVYGNYTISDAALADFGGGNDS